MVPMSTTARETTLLNHWIAGRGDEARAERGSEVTDRAPARSSHGCRTRRPPTSTAPSAAAKAGRGWGAPSLARLSGDLRVARAPQPPTDRRADHAPSTARCSPTPRRGAARLEVIEFACGLGHLLKGDTSARCRAASTPTRCASRSASWPASRRSTSRSWSHCGSAPVAPPAATRSCSSPPSRTPRASLLLARAAAPSRPARRRLLRPARRQGSRRRDPRPPRHRRVSFVGSTPVAAYV